MRTFKSAIQMEFDELLRGVFATVFAPTGRNSFMGTSLPGALHEAAPARITKKLKDGWARSANGLVFGVLALGLLGAPVVAAADSNEVRLSVTATVLKHASLKVLAQPASVVITAADISRGYVDVPSPAQVAIQSNSQEGYMLMFASEGGFMRQTLVRGLGHDVQLDMAGGGIARGPEGRGMAKATLDLGFRFVLSESAQQGVYPWPMRLSVTPL